MWSNLKDLTDNPKLVVSFSFCGVLAATIIYLLIEFKDHLTTEAALLGAAMGWASGILLAPYESERKAFQRYSKAVAGFISGFLLAKADRVFELYMDEKHRELLVDPVIGQRAGVLLAAFFTTAITVFLARTYWQQDGEEPDEESVT